MHADIKRVLGTLKKLTDHPKGRIAIDLSSGQYTPMGKLLGLMYYRTNIVDQLERTEYFGYPHGGQHTFSYRGDGKTFAAFIELLKEELQNKFIRGLNEEEQQVLSELSFISQDILALR
jgi:hypothetical protein